MGVVNLQEARECEATRHHVLAGNLHPTCYFCGTEITGTFVYWSGTDAALIHLHHDCARELGQHLIRDGMNATDIFVRRR